MEEFVNMASELAGRTSSEETQFKLPTSTLKRRMKLFNNSLQCDLHLKSSTDETFFAHTSILKERSPKFLKHVLEQSSLKENNTNQVLEVTLDISAGCLLALLKYLYLAKLEVELHLSPELLRLSELHSLDDLRKSCAQFIQKQVDFDNVCDLFRLADYYKTFGLKNACLQIIKKNFLLISKTAGFHTLSQNPLLLIEIAQSINNSSHTNAFQVGKRVTLVDGVTGVIRYVGKAEFDGGKSQWLGIETDLPLGTHDGSVNGIRYFQTRPQHGLFVGIWFI